MSEPIDSQKLYVSVPVDRNYFNPDEIEYIKQQLMIAAENSVKKTTQKIKENRAEQRIREAQQDAPREAGSEGSSESRPQATEACTCRGANIWHYTGCPAIAAQARAQAAREKSKALRDRFGCTDTPCVYHPWID